MFRGSGVFASNMLTHMRRYHPDVSVTGVRKKMLTVQQLIPGAFNQTLSNKTDRAKKITEAIRIYISPSMRPYLVVEEPGFKYLLKVLEPRYCVPSRAHISQSVLPAIYKRTRAVVEQELSTAHAVALTTDGWTSRSTESYLTALHLP